MFVASLKHGPASARGQRNRAGHASLRRRDPIYKTAILEIVPATPLNMRPYFGGVPAFRSCETAVTSCAGANGFAKRMLLKLPYCAAPLRHPSLKFGIWCPVAASWFRDRHPALEESYSTHQLEI